jgi:hypothetical protein
MILLRCIGCTIRNCSILFLACARAQMLSKLCDRRQGQVWPGQPMPEGYHVTLQAVHWPANSWLMRLVVYI